MSTSTKRERERDWDTHSRQVSRLTYQLIEMQHCIPSILITNSICYNTALLIVEVTRNNGVLKFPDLRKSFASNGITYVFCCTKMCICNYQRGTREEEGEGLKFRQKKLSFPHLLCFQSGENKILKWITRTINIAFFVFVYEYKNMLCETFF